MKGREGGVRKRKWYKERAGDTDSDRVEEVEWRGKKNKNRVQEK